jgi:hypothetical protein
MESTSVVNRSGSGRARPKILSALRHACCDEGPVFLAVETLGLDGLVRRGGRRGRRGRAMLVGRLGRVELVEDLSDMGFDGAFGDQWPGRRWSGWTCPRRSARDLSSRSLTS